MYRVSKKSQPTFEASYLQKYNLLIDNIFTKIKLITLFCYQI